MQQIINYVALTIGSVAGVVIVYGVITGIVELIQAEGARFRRTSDEKKIKHITFEKIRYDIGFHLLLGLEFLIAADIIRTIISPTLEELAILGGLVVIRTVISYFLGREIKQQNQNS